jgi:hypothetical protein
MVDPSAVTVTSEARRAEGQLDVHLHVLIGVDDDALVDRGLELGRFHRERVRADGNVGEEICAAGVRGNRTGEAMVRVGQRRCRSGQHRAAGVSDGAEDAAAVLRTGGAGGQTKGEQQAEPKVRSADTARGRRRRAGSFLKHHLAHAGPQTVSERHWSDQEGRSTVSGFAARTVKWNPAHLLQLRRSAWFATGFDVNTSSCRSHPFEVNQRSDTKLVNATLKLRFLRFQPDGLTVGQAGRINAVTAVTSPPGCTVVS